MANSYLKDKWLWILVVTTFVVRLIYLIQLNQDAGFQVPIIDELWHWQWAHEILEKSFLGDTAYFRAPLYPYFLAILAKLTSSSIFYSKLLQTLVACGTILFLYKLSYYLFNKTVAIIVGFIYAFYGTIIFYETMFLIPILFLFFTVWGMFRLIAYKDSRSLKTWLLTGIIFGLAVISRPNILIVLPFLALWLFWQMPSRKSILHKIKLPLIMIVGVIIIIAPITIRNFIVTGEFILISSQGGVNLYIGNNSDASGLSMRMPEIDNQDLTNWKYFQDVTKITAQKEAGRELNETEQSSFWTNKAINFILENPNKFGNLLWQKTVYLFNGFENSDNSDLYFQRQKSSLYSLLVWKIEKFLMFPFGLLVPLFFAGIYALRKKRKELQPIYIFIITYIPSIILFLVTARHRLVLIPFMIIIATAGIYTLIKNSKKYNFKNWIIITLLFLIPFVMVNRTWYLLGYSNEYQSYLNEGIKYFKMKDYVHAEQKYILANRAYSYSAPLQNNLGYTQFLLGKYNNAETNYLRAIQNDPNYFKAYNNYGLLLDKRGQLDSAINMYKMATTLFDSSSAELSEHSRYFINMANTYIKMKQPDSAELAFEAAMNVAPNNGNAFLSVATYYASTGKSRISDSLFTIANQKTELSAQNYLNWGLVVLSVKNYDKGIKLMHKAFERDHQLFQAPYCIGRAYYDKENAIDSVLKYLDQSLRISPYFAPALELKSRVLER